MNAVFKRFLMMSCSGTLLILVLLFGKRFLKDRVSRQWQYYIWLLVIMRLLLPFGAKINLMGQAYRAVGQVVNEQAPILRQRLRAVGQGVAPGAGSRQETSGQAGDLTAAHIFWEILSLLADHIWLLWLAVALGMLIRKATVYQSFVRYIKLGLAPVSDMDTLDRFFVIAGQMGIQKPVELCVNPQIPSPLFMGVFHPCIVLPSVDIPEKDFRHIMLHELTHYKRRDMPYKWLVQITVCLHWFNPFVHLMSWELTKACEFSCDEAVLLKIGRTNAAAYGKTLLDAMAAIGKYKEPIGAVRLSENKKILKDRLAAIVKFERESKPTRFFTGLLTLCMAIGASFLGVSPAAASGQTLENRTVSGINETFQISFTRLDEQEQLLWLQKCYADGNFAFFSSAVDTFKEDDPRIASLAEKAYTDGKIVFFSTLTDRMGKTKLQRWLDKALEDERWDFQSMLSDKLELHPDRN